MNLAKLHLHWTIKTVNQKEYRSYSLARSHRIEGKVRKEIVHKLGVLSEDGVCQWKQLLLYAKNLAKKAGKGKTSSTNFQEAHLMDNFQTLFDETSKKRFLYDQSDKTSDEELVAQALQKVFSEVLDPREQDNCAYSFYGILLMILAGTLASAKSISAIHEYAQNKASIFLPWLGTEKVPGYMAFWWILTRCNSESLNNAFLKWIKSMADSIEVKGAKRIAVDGKALRGAKQSAVHYVSAYDSTRGLLLGQVKTEKKSNEIKAIPELLKVIDIKDALVTIDAAGCQKKICLLIRDLGGHYCIALKRNQGTLYAEAENFFTQARAVDYEEVPCNRSSASNKGHGRIETREVVVTNDLSWLDCKKNWKDLTTLIEVKSIRTIKGKTTEDFRYYISSKNMTAKNASTGIRSHWSVENNLHWALDVLFDDDGLSANRGHAAENLGLFRRMAYCLLKQDTAKGRGLASQQRKAMWNDDYVLEILGRFIKQVGSPIFKKIDTQECL